MKILYLLPVSSQARYQKRIYALEKFGARSQVMAFERTSYPGKAWKQGFTSLGKIDHSHYFKRLIPFIRAFPLIREKARECTVLYVFGLDMLLLGWIALFGIRTDRKIVYEVGDLREIQLGNSVFSNLVRYLEKLLVKRIYLLVSTSPGFINGFYRGTLGLENFSWQVIENKIDPSAIGDRKKTDLQVVENDKIVIGYFGLIRDQQSWKILKKALALSDGSLEIYVAGLPMNIDTFYEDINSIDGLRYRGPFVSPDELRDMYHKVNITWACYPFQGKKIGNWRYARTNRFYESCFFRKPMIAQKGTLDGAVVREKSLGLCLDLADIEDSVQKLLNLNYQVIQTWKKNVLCLPEDIYLYTDEHEKLFEVLQ